MAYCRNGYCHKQYDDVLSEGPLPEYMSSPGLALGNFTSYTNDKVTDTFDFETMNRTHYSTKR